MLHICTVVDYKEGDDEKVLVAMELLHTEKLTRWYLVFASIGESSIRNVSFNETS